jgi:hypothetical protein
VGDRYPLGHHGTVTSCRPYKRLLMVHLKGDQWASVGWQPQTSREDTCVGTKGFSCVLCMQRTRTIADDSLTMAGRNVAWVRRDVEIMHPRPEPFSITDSVDNKAK